MAILTRLLQAVLTTAIVANLAVENIFAVPQTSPTPNVTLTKVTVNSDFENGIDGWQSVTSKVNVVTRNWTPDPNNDFSLKRLGQKALSLNGDGYFSQWIIIPPGTKYHVAQIKAARRPYIAFTDPLEEGWAGFGITYYDVNWNEIDDVYDEIYGVFNADPAKSYSGLVTYSVGGVVPPQAVFATLWCTNDSIKSEVIIDDFSMFSVKFNSNAIRGLPLLIFSSSILPRPPEADLREDLFLRPAEIWRETIFGVTRADRGFGTFVSSRFGSLGLQVGSNNRPATMAQLLPAEPGKRYALTLSAGVTSKDAGAFGIDCYDKSGAKIATRSSLLKENPVIGAFEGAAELKTTLNILIPKSTYSAYYWVWIGQGKRIRINSVSLDVVP